VRGGKFITLEGGEGAGKSTQVKLLCDVLRRADLTVVATREPGGSPGAEEIRHLLVAGEPDRWDAMTEALLHFAARRDHVVKTVKPALARGDWVVSDRFADSTVAYQGYAHGLGREVVQLFYTTVVGELVPDLTIILDLPAALGLARERERGGEDRYERMDEVFHQRLRAGFLDIARREPERCVVVDARPGVETVHGEVVAAVRERLGLAVNA
jgi:dTMP kinase